MKVLLDVQRMNATMRDRCVDLEGEAVLVSRIAGSEQEADLTLPANLEGFGRIRHFRYEAGGLWPANPYPGLPASQAMGLPFQPETKAQLVQIAGCGMRCWYCFVPYPMLSGSERNASWITARQLVELYRAQPDRPQVLVLSGGSPDIAPEWISWVLSALDAAALGDQTFLWSDDNLSSSLMLEEPFLPHLDVLRTHRNYGKVVCLKGFDATSFSFNTQAHPDGFETQLRILDGYLRLGLNLFGYITLTTPTLDTAAGAIRRLMDRIEAVDVRFLSRLLPLRITKYGSMVRRLDQSRSMALQLQDKVLKIWLKELAERQVAPIWQI